MSYFKRREKIYASLDADRVDEATFTPEGPDHPCFVLVPIITLGALAEVADLKSETAKDGLDATAAGVAVVVERLEGRWDYYPGGAADWPQRWAEAEHVGRVELTQRFSADEMMKLRAATNRKATLTEEERGES